MGIVYPQQIGLLVRSLTKIFQVVYLAYWLDRWVFWYAQPGEYRASTARGLDAISLLMLCRTILMAAISIAVELGV